MSSETASQLSNNNPPAKETSEGFAIKPQNI